MKISLSKPIKFIGWFFISIVLLLLVLSSVFGILFILGVWYEETFM